MFDSFVTIKLEGKDDTCVQLFPDTGFFRVVEQKMDLLFFSNGSAQMTEVDGQDELIALYAYNN